MFDLVEEEIVGYKNSIRRIETITEALTEYSKSGSFDNFEQ